jgi:hypothetical protein
MTITIEGFSKAIDEWYERYQTHYNRVVVTQNKVNTSYLALKVLVVAALPHLDPILIEPFMEEVNKYDESLTEFAEALSTWADDFGELHTLSQQIDDAE